jgi:Ca2+-binding RTX toxin-like protein
MLTMALSGSGAANTTATDTFSYTLAGGGSATVTVTIEGVNDANTIYQDSSGGDTITGSPTIGSLYQLQQGGDDRVTGGSGDDGFYFGAQFTGDDRVNGGGGNNDQIGLEGDYSGGVTLSGSHISGVEVLAMMPGFDYRIATDGTLSAAGQTFSFWSVSMTAPNSVSLDMSGEAGNFRFFLGQGTDIAKGGAGSDIFYGDGGADTLTGGAGADTFAYLHVSDSHGNAGGTAYDTITDFVAGTDKFRLSGVTVTAVDSAVNGSLSGASFETDLANSFGSGVPHALAAGHAVVFHVTGGGLAGHDFLIVNAHGGAGYLAGSDYVFDVTGGSLASLATSDFV